MIRITIIYNRTEHTTFDYDYYVKTHMTMVGRLTNPVKIEADKIAQMPDGGPAPVHCIGYVYYNSLEDMQKSSGTDAVQELMADIPNYYKGGHPIILTGEIEEIPV